MKTTTKRYLIQIIVPAVLAQTIEETLSHFGIDIDYHTNLQILIALYSLTFYMTYYIFGPQINAADFRSCRVDDSYTGKAFEHNWKKYSFSDFLNLRISKLKSKKNSSLIRRYKLCLKNPPPDPPSEIDFLALIIVLRTRQDIDTDFMNPEHLLMDISEYIRPNSQV